LGDDGQDNRGGEEEAGRALGSEVLRRLRRDRALDGGYFLIDHAAPGCDDPFGALVATILSQNTNDRNGYAAFSSLAESIGVTPWKISRAPLGALEDAIRPAGIYRERARKLREMARIVVERYGGDLSRVLAMDMENARTALMELPGVGPKTADVVLLFCASMPTFPVDTHISRVSRRLGLVRAGAGYEEIRSRLQSIFEPGDYRAAHRLLIQLGRVHCRARGPRCDECPMSDICPRIGLETRSPDRG